MLSVVIQALKKVGYVPLYTFRKSLFDIERLGFWITLHSSSARRDSPVQIHLITAESVMKRLSLYEFTLWGRDLVSVVRTVKTHK